MKARFNSGIVSITPGPPTSNLVFKISSVDGPSVVRLFWLKEVLNEEIGPIVGRPEGMLKSILHRVRQKLRNKLKELESVTVENGDAA